MSHRQTRRPRPAGALVLVAVLVGVFTALMAATGATAPRLGIDLAGGTSVTLTATSKDPGAVTEDSMGLAASILQKRVNGLGVSEAEVQVQGGRTIVVNIPAGGDQQQAVDQIGKTAKLSFRPVLAQAAAQAGGDTPGVPAELTAPFAALDCTEATQRVDHQSDPAHPGVACSQDTGGGGWVKYALGPVAVEGADVTDASASLDTDRTGGWQVALEFNDTGAARFATTTGALAGLGAGGNQFAIVLDGQVLSAPAVHEAISGGRAQITGSFGRQEAQGLANSLRFGALPLDFTQSDVTTVSAQLGAGQLAAGLVAGGIGLVLVVGYCVGYYRALGLVAVAGLAVSTVLTWQLMCLLGAGVGFALNLPAVCGAIVAIGITADSFVVYFERVRDQLRDGVSLRAAVERAWPKARRTILVSDFVSFLAAAVLFTVSVGKVQGFAFTLGLTTLLDVVVVALFTKPLLALLARLRFFATGHRWSGLDARRLQIRPPLRRARRASSRQGPAVAPRTAAATGAGAAPAAAPTHSRRSGDAQHLSEGR
ncbi:protein translocase subunit SecD [Kitasatospora sp. NPDC088346]|uniref:protein translocase subunit SecD n=1 Tax=Kitasatospora sp. NPDC088346 TaxID=3364073 RepID=UPI00382DF9A2